MPAAPDQERSRVLLAYTAFVLVGVSAAVGGVLLPAQILDYGASKATIGLIFVTGSAGFALSGVTAGALIHRAGFRTALAVGGAAYLLAALGTAARPPFVVLVLVQVLLGYGAGVLESVLNAYLAGLPEPTGPLNRLHAFFGVGALIGPSLAAWMLSRVSWPTVWLVLALLCVPLLVAFLMAYPRAAPAEPSPEPPVRGRERLLAAVLRERAVVLGAVFLSIYVGLEMSVGSWAFTFLIENWHQRDVLAGYAVTGYWLGLTVGRFVISPLGSRLGLSAISVTSGCLVGVGLGAVVVWLAPVAFLASAGLAMLGFFLGPLFPTVMSVAPRLTVARLVPTAVGLMVGTSVVGGAALPWLAGVIAQHAGAWTLLPYSIGLTVLLGAVWWRLARRLPSGQEQPRRTRPGRPAGAPDAAR
ncbi:MAG TPA: MFS transporter [Jatrophihabitantaceae bacterium]|nr:MFS transporter [Jatrophihabitantaceae bacterium]